MSDHSECILLIHGLWMNGFEMSLLRRRLAEASGQPTRRFTYASVTRGLARNAQRLRRAIDAIPAERVHIIAHSLGGVLTLQTLRRQPVPKVGRIVCLGSPLRGSAPARLLTRFEPGRFIVGRTLRDSVLEAPLESIDLPQPVGMIAGTKGVGIARVLGVLPKPNDGVVAVSETQLPGLTAHIQMPVNHFGLLTSSAVAEEALRFIREGRFGPTSGSEQLAGSE